MIYLDTNMNDDMYEEMEYSMSYMPTKVNYNDKIKSDHESLCDQPTQVSYNDHSIPVEAQKKLEAN